MWSMLRGRALSCWKFRRQHAIGFFILDFYCPSLQLAIELDGAPHLDEGGRAGDALRSAELNAIGITVMRFENGDVLENSSSVLRRIEEVARRIEMSRLV